MKKIKRESSTTLTYEPFKNLDELIKASKNNKKENKEGTKK